MVSFPTTTNILLPIILSQLDRVLFEKLTATSQWISSFHETQRFITVFTTASHCSTSSGRWIQSTASKPFSFIFILILSSHLLTCLQSSLFLRLAPMHTTCPTNQTILLSQLHLARIINYEAPSLAFLHHSIASYLFRQTTALLFFSLRCNNSILCSVSSRPSYRRGRQWYSVFTLWSLNEGQIRPSVGKGLIKS